MAERQLADELTPAFGTSNNGPLAERLDDALGEASSGIGVLLSELVRRTLRGGVQKIDEEMHDFVEEKLEDAVAARMPQFEDAATEAATQRAHDVATEAVSTVDRDAKQSAAHLAERIADAEKRSTATTERLLQDVRDKSKGVVTKIQANLQQLHGNTQKLHAQLKDESQSRISQLDQLRQETLAQVAQLQKRIGALETELAELKKPRGIFSWFRRDKKDAVPRIEDTPDA